MTHRDLKMRLGERGFALPTAMFFMLGMLAILAIGAVAAVNTQRGTVRDANSKSALAVAEAGAEAALLRYGRYTTSNTTRCLVPAEGASDSQAFIPDEPMTAEDGLPAGSGQEGWCRPVTGATDNGTYRYWVKPISWSEEGVDIEIVSEGFVDNPSTDEDVMRRIQLFAHAKTVCDPSCGGTPEEEEPEEEEPVHDPPHGYLGNESIVGINWLKLDNDAKIDGAAGSNGVVTIIDSAKVCGPLRLGPDTPSPVGLPKSQWVQPPEARPFSNGTGGGICYPPGYVITSGTREYPPVVLPDDIATNNSNARLAGADPVPNDVWQRGNISWDANNRRLTVNYSQLKLQGTAPYFLCRLELAGGSTLIGDAPGQPVRIFFDRPENCGNINQQFVIANGTKLISNGFVPGLFFLGSDTKPTTIIMAGGAATHQVVIYAPKTDVDISNGFRFNGAVIGKTLHVAGGSGVVPGFDGSTYPIPVEVPEDDGGSNDDDEDESEETGEYRLVSSGEFTKSNYSECPASAVQERSMEAPSAGCE